MTRDEMVQTLRKHAAAFQQAADALEDKQLHWTQRPENSDRVKKVLRAMRKQRKAA